ncbi:MAG: polyphosphate:AMP phosphotransferase [Pusillimonas sp.]
MTKELTPSHHFEVALSAAESDPVLDKKAAKEQIADLRVTLLKAQYALLEQANQSVLVVIAGLDGVGKGGCINMLNEWIDPRHIITLAYGPPGPELQGVPPLWRYWRNLPAKGSAGVVFGSWYRELFEELAQKSPDEGRVRALAQEVREFEAVLTHNGVQVVKLWFHMSKKAQEERVDSLLASPDTSWQVNPLDLEVRKKFDRARAIGALAMTLTHDKYSPWVVIPSADENTRHICTGQAVLATLRRHPRPPVIPPLVADDATFLPEGAVLTNPEAITASSRVLSLDDIDYSAKLKKSDYEQMLTQLQARLAHLVRDPRFANFPLILVFEGQDAAGKGGTIRRITHAIDARQYRAIPIAAPTDEELARPYLWRFWRKLPSKRRVGIFDRSWYGRVLVERIEGYASEPEWRRAYSEINQFEHQLVDHGAIVLKFWLAITKDEQLERFNARKKSPFKNFKITEEDWRNRKRWDDYVQATNDMFRETSTDRCPWHLVSANDKNHARIEVLRTVVEAMEAGLARYKKGNHA